MEGISDEIPSIQPFLLEMEMPRQSKNGAKK